MIKVPRITVGYTLSYHNVSIYEKHEMLSMPNYFEDGLVAFSCKDGIFMIPEYHVSLIQYSTIQIRTPTDIQIYKRITIVGEQPFEKVWVIPPDQYSVYNIPLIFPGMKQFAFSCKDGTFICADENIILLQIE